MKYLHRGRALGHGPASEFQGAGSQTRSDTEDAYNEGEGREGVGSDQPDFPRSLALGPPDPTVILTLIWTVSASLNTELPPSWVKYNSAPDGPRD